MSNDSKIPTFSQGRRACMCVCVFQKQPEDYNMRGNRLAHHWAAAEQSTSFCGLPKLVKDTKRCSNEGQSTNC